MAGSKTIFNNSSVAISVTVTQRLGEPGNDGASVSGNIDPQTSVTLQYGDNDNPYMNALAVTESFNGPYNSATFVTSARGGPGTLDNLFNTNSTIVVAYNTANYGFSITAHN